MSTTKLIEDSVEAVKEVFDKLDINTTLLDFTGKNEALFNQVFIRAFLDRLNVGDYKYFKELRDDFLQPAPNIITVDNPFANVEHSSDSQE